MARPKSPEKKELIRKAAIRVISEEGFHKCTTDKIAEEAGVSVGTIYNYFSDKKDILSYIFKIEHKKLRIFFQRVSREDFSIPKKIKILIDKYYKYVFNNKRIAKILHDEGNRASEDITQEILYYMLSIRKQLKVLLKEGIKEGTICSELDLDMMVNMIIGSANAIAFLRYLKPEKIDYICTSAADNLYKMLSKGIFLSE